MNNTIRLEYDDDAYNAILKANSVLKNYGLEFIDDEKEHDGFIIMQIKNTGDN
jgi:hypothetical protein